MRVTITPLRTYPGACAIQARLYNKECAHARPSVARIQSFVSLLWMLQNGGRKVEADRCRATEGMHSGWSISSSIITSPSRASPSSAMSRFWFIPSSFSFHFHFIIDWTGSITVTSNDGSRTVDSLLFSLQRRSG